MSMVCLGPLFRLSLNLGFFYASHPARAMQHGRNRLVHRDHCDHVDTPQEQHHRVVYKTDTTPWIEAETITITLSYSLGLVLVRATRGFAQLSFRPDWSTR